MHTPLYRLTLSTVVASAMLLAVPAMAAQEAVSTTTQPVSVVPHLIKFSGALPGASSKAETVDVKFSLYAAQTGGDPLWSETQSVSLDPTGKYSVLLGSVTTLPDSVFAQGQARWIGVTLGSNQESVRTILVATPYSLKASDSETLGGHPASDFTLKNALAPGGTDITQINVGNGVTGGGTGPTVTLGLSSSYLETLGNSIYPQIAGTNTLTGKNTYSAGKLFIGTSPVLSAANVVASSPVSVSASGNNVTIGLSDSALLTLGNSVYAQLGAANTFTKAMTFASGQTFPGTATVAGSNTFSGSNTFTKAITFASGQTFPGTGTITGITTSSPLSGSGTSGSVALSLNTSALESTLNGVYSGLSSNNTFSGTDAFTGLVTVTGSEANGNDVPNITGQLSVNDLVTGTSSNTPLAVFANAPNIGIGVDGNGAIGVFGYAPAQPSGFVSYGVEGYGQQVGGSFVAPDGGTGQGAVNGSGVEATGYTGVLAYGDADTGTGVSAAGYIGVLGYYPYSLSGEGAFYGQYFPGIGVQGDTNQLHGTGVLATADDGIGALIANNSPDGYSTLDVENNDTTGNSYVFGAFNIHNGTQCNINYSATLTCDGGTAVSNSVGDRKVLTYGVQSAENWIEDFGSGQLSAGSAHISLEPTFAATVNTGEEYHVFLTPRGDSEGLYVTNTGADGFDVKESHGGHSAVGFDYRIVAKRKGYENVRMEDVTAGRERQKAIHEEMHQRAASAPKRTLPAPARDPRINPLIQPTRIHPTGISPKIRAAAEPQKK
jgi:hypothetical protein